MALPQDSAPKFQEYAHPEMIVSTEWVAQHLDDPGLVVAESDEDVLLYETGHVPGAVKLDWHTELNDPVTRDYVDGAGFARLMSEKGISRDTTLVLYGDKNNWWAAYALWVTKLFGHPDVRLMDGGRAKWIAEGRPLSTDTPKPAPADDATFKPRKELEAIYQGEAGLSPDDDVVVYCRIGERSSHTWFVLQHLLGFGQVRHSDGSWTEWGNSVRVPITRGDSP